MAKMATIRPVALIVTFALVNYCQSFLLLPGLLPQNLVSVHRRQIEQIPRHLPGVSEPTCAELRAMWHHMNRMARDRHSELTNEIPQFPNIFDHLMPMRGYPNYLEYPVGKIRTRPDGRRQPTRSTKIRINSIDEQTYPTGIFEGPAVPKEALGIFGTVVKSPAEKQRVKDEQYRRGIQVEPDELGTFTFPVLEEDNAYKKKYRYKYANVRNTDSTQDQSFYFIPGFTNVDRGPISFQTNSVLLSKPSCKRFENKRCERQKDCYCTRNQLQCVEGKCLRSKVLIDSLGIWHDGPLDSSALGMVRQKREDTRTIVM